MSTDQSNLSDPRFGFDLVVAVTQKSINVTMKELLDGLSAPEVIVCYVYDSSNNLAQIPYDTLKANAKGADPFGVADGANPATDPSLVNLAAANFAGAFKAQIGLPDMDPTQIPPIVTLGVGTSAPVTFNLLCAEFQIVGFQYGPRGSSTWINQSEPSGAPWYFTSHVQLNTTTIDPSSPVPPAVQQRIQQLLDTVGPQAFSVQRLFLDLDTAILLSSPTVVGIPEGWAVWNLIQSDFLGAYFTQLRATGDPALGYSFSSTTPDPSTLQLGAMSRECSPLLDGSGNPIVNPTPDQANAATLDYLCATSTTPPVAVMFPWNWVELAELSDYSGIQAVRRGIIVGFLANLLNPVVASLCLTPTVSLTQGSGFEDPYEVGYYISQAPSPTTFQATAPGTAAGSDGFTSILTLTTFSAPSSAECEANDHLSSVNGEFNYTLTGDVAVNGNQIRLTLHAVAYMAFGHHEMGVPYHDLPGANYVDKTLTVTFQFDVSNSGSLVVNAPVPQISDASAAWNFHPEGVLSIGGNEDAVKDGVTNTNASLSSLVSTSFESYSTEITAMINGAQSWVFPGGKTFAFNKVAFSAFQDLVTHVTYVNPS